MTGLTSRLKCFEPVGGVFCAAAEFDHRFNGAVSEGAFGRGRSAQEAETGCLAEAIECYSARWQGDEQVWHATLKDIPGAIDPRDILLFSTAQYAGRDLLNRILPERHRIPEPFHPEQPIDWLAAKDLVNGQDAWLPAACCLTGHPAPFATTDTAGCATGPDPSEALLSALLEEIERDATAIWWYNRIRRPSIRLESFQDPALHQIEEGFLKFKRSFFILDITTDLKVPTYVAVSVTAEGRRPVFGIASHFSPRVAAWKAASEAVQIWLCTQLANLPSDIVSWLRLATLEEHCYLRPSGSLNAAPEPEVINTDADIQECVRRLKAQGLRPLSVNLSRPDTGLPVCRVIVPGMRHVCNQRGAGRLFTVPVQLGWSDTPLLESELNPACCVF